MRANGAYLEDETEARQWKELCAAMPDGSSGVVVAAGVRWDVMMGVGVEGAFEKVFR